MLIKIAIIVAIAFIGGTLLANPVADAAGGWKEALENLTVDWSQLTGIPADFADGVDDDTTYSGTSPITVAGTTISLSTTGCTPGEVLKWNGASWQCVQPVSSLGYQRVSAQGSVQPFSTSTVTTNCPGGTNVVGGGYTDVNFGNSVNESFPSSETTWSVTVSNISFSFDAITIYALCIDNTP